MIEPSGPESPREPEAPQRAGPTVLQLVAAGVAVAVLAGAVAAGVTLGVLQLRSRTNPQGVDLRPGVTVNEQNATEDVATKAMPAVVSVVSTDSSQPRGSGFLVTSDGYIVTNLGVVANARGLGVLLDGDAHRHDARLVDYDCQTGLAVLKVDNVSNLPTLAFADPGSLKVGQNVIAVGGSAAQHSGVSKGVISALHRTVNLPDPAGSGVQTQLADVIDTDAAIPADESGAPLLNVGGQVVGLTMASSGLPSFALSTIAIQPSVQQVISAGHLTVASLDAQTVVVSATAAALDGSAAGARIVSLTPGGAADRAGLKVGDVITQLDDQKLGDQFPLAELLHTRFKPQQKVTVSFTRGSSSGQVQLTLIEERPACA